MKKKLHSESEMVKAVKELESGISAETVARNYNITRGTLYNWKNKYSGMEVSQVQKLKELELWACIMGRRGWDVWKE